MSKAKNSLFGFLFLLASCQFTDLRAIYYNNQTSANIKEKSVDESQAGYLKTLEIEPLLPATHSNLGATYDVLKDSEKALKLYKNAEDFTKLELQALPDQPLTSGWEKQAMYLTLFASLYNQGQLLGRDNKIDPALEKYQQALELNPRSIEVKTNIELMLQKQQGGGQGQSNDDDKDKNKDKDQKGKDGKDPNEDDSKDKKGEKPKNYSESKKYKAKEFKGDLTKENVQKIFGEISQQEKKMRMQFSKQNQTKESPREKDW